MIINKTLGQTVKVKIISPSINTTILPYLYQKGIIVGYKLIKQQLIISIIEFPDFTRVWMSNQEIRIIQI